MIRYLLGAEPSANMWENITVTFNDTPTSHWAYMYVALVTTGLR